MEYRTAWLNNTGAITRHYEVMLHAIERDIPEGPLKMLIVGVDNGGPLELWPQVLPEGSLVIGIDSDPNAGRLPVPVHIGEPRDRAWLREVLADRAFDVIIDRTPDAGENTWPWLTPGGRLLLEDPDPDDAVMLSRDVALDQPSWLPVEEIMRVSVYPRVLVVEKRSPRVMPYIEIMTGNFADVVPEWELIEQGVKRVLVD